MTSPLGVGGRRGDMPCAGVIAYVHPVTVETLQGVEVERLFPTVDEIRSAVESGRFQLVDGKMCEHVAKSTARGANRSQDQSLICIYDRERSCPT